MLHQNDIIIPIIINNKCVIYRSHDLRLTVFINYYYRKYETSPKEDIIVLKITTQTLRTLNSTLFALIVYTKGRCYKVRKIAEKKKKRLYSYSCTYLNKLSILSYKKPSHYPLKDESSSLCGIKSLIRVSTTTSLSTVHVSKFTHGIFYFIQINNSDFTTQQRRSPGIDLTSFTYVGLEMILYLSFCRIPMDKK